MRKKLLGILLGLIVYLSLGVSAVVAGFETYVKANPPQASVVNQTIQSKLVAEINKVIAAGHLAPTVYITGLSISQQGLLYYYMPADVLSGLLTAYPYLPANVQTSLKAYIDNEIASFNPLTTGYYPNNGTLGSFAGARREFYPINQGAGTGVWPPPGVGVEVAYPLWQYTYYTGDRRFVDNSSNWNQLLAIYNANTQPTTYSQVIGLMGFSRLARIKGDTLLADTVANNLATVMTTKNFDTFSAAADNILFLREGQISYPVFGWGRRPGCTGGCAGFAGFLFDPQLGAYLRDTPAELSRVTAYSQTLERSHPVWFLTLPASGMTRQMTFGWGENNFALPDLTWTNFMIHAYVFRNNFNTLRNYLDFPSRLGDLFYIRQLVATIEAPGATVSEKGTVAGTAVENSNDENSYDLSLVERLNKLILDMFKLYNGGDIFVLKHN